MQRVYVVPGRVRDGGANLEKVPSPDIPACRSSRRCRAEPAVSGTETETNRGPSPAARAAHDATRGLLRPRKPPVTWPPHGSADPSWTVPHPRVRRETRRTLGCGV